MPDVRLIKSSPCEVESLSLYLTAEYETTVTFQRNLGGDVSILIAVGEDEQEKLGSVSMKQMLNFAQRILDLWGEP
jgi:hypothetical protein